jgi:hypothetical protein
VITDYTARQHKKGRNRLPGGAMNEKKIPHSMKERGDIKLTNN